MGVGVCDQEDGGLAKVGRNVNFQSARDAHDRMNNIMLSASLNFGTVLIVLPQKVSEEKLMNLLVSQSRLALFLMMTTLNRQAAN